MHTYSIQLSASGLGSRVDQVRLAGPLKLLV